MGAHPGALCQGPVSTRGACFKSEASAHSTCDDGSQSSSITWAGGSLLRLFLPTHQAQRGNAELIFLLPGGEETLRL